MYYDIRKFFYIKSNAHYLFNQKRKKKIQISRDGERKIHNIDLLKTKQKSEEKNIGGKKKL